MIIVFVCFVKKKSKKQIKNSLAVAHIHLLDAFVAHGGDAHTVTHHIRISFYWRRRNHIKFYCIQQYENRLKFISLFALRIHQPTSIRFRIQSFHLIFSFLFEFNSVRIVIRTQIQANTSIV